MIRLYRLWKHDRAQDRLHRARRHAGNFDAWCILFHAETEMIRHRRTI